MAGGHPRYTICLFTYTALLLFGIFVHDVEASRCQHVFHKKVGDTVELSSCLPTEGVTLARWKHGELIIADKDKDVSGKSQFKGRLKLDPTNFTLTVREVTLQDSGDYIFVSAVNDLQRGTVTITLYVHELLTREPIVTFDSTLHTVNESCTVLLECSAASDSSVMYSWAVRNQTIHGSRLQYIIKPQDGDTRFTCTISNFFSEKSASKTVTCSSNPQESVPSSVVPLIIGMAIGILLFVVLMLSLLFYTKSKDLCCNRVIPSQTVNRDETQQHVYSSLLHGDGCVYETIRGSEDAVTGGPPNQYSNVTSPSVHLKDLGRQSNG